MVDPRKPFEGPDWDDGDDRNSGDDGLGELLRGAWEELPAPEADRGAGEDPDAATRATLAWMRAAWDSQPVPEARPSEVLRPVAGNVPARGPARAPGGAGPRTRAADPAWAAAALAAAVLGFLGFRLIPGDGSSSSGPGSPDRGRIARNSAENPGPKRVPERSPVPVASLRPDRMELRSGNVRLILLTGEPSADTLPGSTDSGPSDSGAPDLRTEGNR